MTSPPRQFYSLIEQKMIEAAKKKHRGVVVTGRQAVFIENLPPGTQVIPQHVINEASRKGWSTITAPKDFRLKRIDQATGRIIGEAKGKARVAFAGQVFSEEDAPANVVSQALKGAKKVVDENGVEVWEGYAPEDVEFVVVPSERGVEVRLEQAHVKDSFKKSLPKVAFEASAKVLEKRGFKVKKADEQSGTIVAEADVPVRVEVQGDALKQEDATFVREVLKGARKVKEESGKEVWEGYVPGEYTFKVQAQDGVFVVQSSEAKPTVDVEAELNKASEKFTKDAALAPSEASQESRPSTAGAGSAGGNPRTAPSLPAKVYSTIESAGYDIKEINFDWHGGYAVAAGEVPIQITLEGEALKTSDATFVRQVLHNARKVKDENGVEVWEGYVPATVRFDINPINTTTAEITVADVEIDPSVETQLNDLLKDFKASYDTRAPSLSVDLPPAPTYKVGRSNSREVAELIHRNLAEYYSSRTKTPVNDAFIPSAEEIEKSLNQENQATASSSLNKTIKLPTLSFKVSPTANVDVASEVIHRSIEMKYSSQVNMPVNDVLIPTTYEIKANLVKAGVGTASNTPTQQADLPTFTTEQAPPLLELTGTVISDATISPTIKNGVSELSGLEPFKVPDSWKVKRGHNTRWGHVEYTVPPDELKTDLSWWLEGKPPVETVTDKAVNFLGLKRGDVKNGTDEAYEFIKGVFRAPIQLVTMPISIAQIATNWDKVKTAAALEGKSVTQTLFSDWINLGKWVFVKTGQHYPTTAKYATQLEKAWDVQPPHPGFIGELVGSFAIGYGLAKVRASFKTTEMEVPITTRGYKVSSSVYSKPGSVFQFVPDEAVGKYRVVLGQVDDVLRTTKAESFTYVEKMPLVIKRRPWGTKVIASEPIPDEFTYSKFRTVIEKPSTGTPRVVSMADDLVADLRNTGEGALTLTDIVDDQINSFTIKGFVNPQDVKAFVQQAVAESGRGPYLIVTSSKYLPDEQLALYSVTSYADDLVKTKVKVSPLTEANIAEDITRALGVMRERPPVDVVKARLDAYSEYLSQVTESGRHVSSAGKYFIRDNTFTDLFRFVRADMKGAFDFGAKSTPTKSSLIVLSDTLEQAMTSTWTVTREIGKVALPETATTPIVVPPISITTTKPSARIGQEQKNLPKTQGTATAPKTLTIPQLSLDLATRKLGEQATTWASVWKAKQGSRLTKELKYGLEVGTQFRTFKTNTFLKAGVGENLDFTPQVDIRPLNKNGLRWRLALKPVTMTAAEQRFDWKVEHNQLEWSVQSEKLPTDISTLLRLQTVPLAPPQPPGFTSEITIPPSPFKPPKKKSSKRQKSSIEKELRAWKKRLPGIRFSDRELSRLAKMKLWW